jgi:small redox-active disulfide protein 2
MKIQVLGSGCATCHQLFELTQTAVKDLGLSDEVEYVTDVQKVIEMGVMQSPVMAINGQPVIVGYLPKLDAVKDAISQVLDSQKDGCCGGCCSAGCHCDGDCC